MSKRQLAGLLLVSVWLNVGLVAYVLTGKDPTGALEVITNGPTASTSEETHTAGSPTTLPPPTVAGSYPLLRVIDGDTIVVGVGDRSESVRLIGIDTPELNDPGGPECYAQEARKYLESIAGGSVTLREDQSQGPRDRYNRILAYAANAEGDDLGYVMLRDGYATEYTYGNPYERTESYKAAEADAMANERGLWAQSACKN